MTKEELLEECKRRYPIGTVFIPAHIPGVNETCIVKEGTFELGDNRVNSPLHPEQKYTPNVYYNGKWAEIVEECIPKQVFPKDSYIVLLASCDGGDCWEVMPVNYCFQLSRDSYEDMRGFNVYSNRRGGPDGWNFPAYENCKLKMRFATDREVAEYNRIGKPYDVTTMIEYICLTEDYGDYGIKGRIYKVERVEKRHLRTVCNLTCGPYPPGASLYFDKSGNWIPATKESYDNQIQEPTEATYEKWKPKVGDLVVFLPGMRFGEEKRFPTPGPYRIDEVGEECISKLSGVYCTLAPQRFKPFSTDDYMVTNHILDAPIITGTGGEIQYTGKDFLNILMNPYDPPPDAWKMNTFDTKLKPFIPKQKEDTSSTFQTITLKSINYVNK